MSLWWDRFRSSVVNVIQNSEKEALADACKAMAAMLQSVNAYIANPNPAAVSDLEAVISSVCNYLFTTPSLQSSCSTVGDDFVTFLSQRVTDIQQFLVLMLQTYCAVPAIALSPASAPSPKPSPAVALSPAPATSDTYWIVGIAVFSVILIGVVLAIILLSKK